MVRFLPIKKGTSVIPRKVNGAPRSCLWFDLCATLNRDRDAYHFYVFVPTITRLWIQAFPQQTVTGRQLHGLSRAQPPNSSHVCAEEPSSENLRASQSIKSGGINEVHNRKVLPPQSKGAKIGTRSVEEIRYCLWGRSRAFYLAIGICHSLANQKSSH